MDINRVSFESLANGGDDVTGALVKLDHNVQELADAVTDGDAAASALTTRVTNVEGKATDLDTRVTAASNGLAAKADKTYVDTQGALKLNKTNPVTAGALSSDSNAVVVQPGSAGQVVLRPNTGSTSGQATVANDGTLTASGAVSGLGVGSTNGNFTGGTSSNNYAVLQAAGFQGDVYLRPSVNSAAGQARLAATGNFSCVSLTQTSSADVKDYLAGYDGALGAIARISVVTFKYVDTFVDDGGKTRIGVIAENVAAVIPEAVTPAETYTFQIPKPLVFDEDGVQVGEQEYEDVTTTTPASVDPMQLACVALRGIQELVTQLAAANASITALTARLEAIEGR